MIIVWTEYMDSDKYQKYFDDQVQKNYYPVAIRGRCISGINKYKAIFLQNVLPILPHITYLNLNIS